jgi:hypothetical protein
MKTYIVTGTHGEYSDRSDWNVCIVHSEERAQEIVKKLGELCEYNESFGGRIRPEFTLPYEATHQKPSLFPASLEKSRPSPEHAALIDACSHGRGTPELKKKLKEFNLLREQENKVARQEQKERYKIDNDWYSLMKENEEKWIKDNYNPPEHLKEMMAYCARNHYSDSHYDYEECPVLDEDVDNYFFIGG